MNGIADHLPPHAREWFDACVKQIAAIETRYPPEATNTATIPPFPLTYEEERRRFLAEVGPVQKLMDGVLAAYPRPVVMSAADAERLRLPDPTQ